MTHNDLLSKPGKDISVTKNRIALYGIAGIEEWATQNADAFKSILRDTLGASEDADVQFFERPQFSGTRLTETITPMMKWLAQVENGGAKPDGSSSIIIVSEAVRDGDRDEKVFRRFADQVDLDVRRNFSSDVPNDASNDQVSNWAETGSFVSTEQIDDAISNLMGSDDEDDEDESEEQSQEDASEVSETADDTQEHEVVPEKPSTPPSTPQQNDEEDEDGDDPFSSFSSFNEDEEEEDIDPFASMSFDDDGDHEDLSAVDEYDRNVGAEDVNRFDDHEVGGNTVESNIDSADQYLAKATGGTHGNGFTPQRQQAMEDETVHNASTEMHSRPSEAGYGNDIRSTTRVMADYKNAENSVERENRSKHPHLSSHSNVFAHTDGVVLGVSGTSGGVGKTACAVVSAKTLAANVDQYNENNRIPMEQRRDVYLLEMDFTNPDLAARENIPTERTLEALAIALDRIGSASFTRHSNQSMSDSSIIEKAIDRMTHIDEETGLKMIASPYQVSVTDKAIQRAFIKVMEHLTALGAIIVIDMPNFDATDPFLVNIIESFTTALFVVTKPSGRNGEVGRRELSRVTKSLTSTQHTGRAQALGLSTERIKVIVNKASNEDALMYRQAASGCEIIGHIPMFPEITTGYDQDIESISPSNMQNLQITLLTFIGRSLSIGKIPEISGIVQDYDPAGFVPKEEKLGFFARFIQFFTR